MITDLTRCIGLAAYRPPTARITLRGTQWTV